MKRPVLLKTILDIIFVFGVLGLSTPFLVFLFALTENPIPMAINGRAVDVLNFSTISLIVVNFLVSALSVYVIYLLRKLTRSFFKNKFFTKQQIFLFKITGRLIVACSIAQILINTFSSFILEGKGRIGLQLGSSFDNLLFVIAVGLFFLYLAKLFDSARIAKEENELTI